MGQQQILDGDIVDALYASSSPTALNPFVTASAVTNVTLTGFTVGPNSTVLASDTMLAALGKLQGQINALRRIKLVLLWQHI